MGVIAATPLMDLLQGRVIAAVEIYWPSVWLLSVKFLLLVEMVCSKLHSEERC